MFLFCRSNELVQAFFAKPKEEKLPHGPAEGPGCFVGYQGNEEKGQEIFEAKRLHDPRWPWPSESMRRPGCR